MSSLWDFMRWSDFGLDQSLAGGELPLTGFAGTEWDNAVVAIRVVLRNLPWIALNDDFVSAWLESSASRSIDTHEVFEALVKCPDSIKCFSVE